MSEYVEVFRVEAKSLLKNFQKHEKEAVARCERVFWRQAGFVVDEYAARCCQRVRV